MNKLTKIGVAAAGFFAAAQVMPLAIAASSGASQHVEDNEIILSSDDAYLALRDIQAGRLAIFNGEPSTAVELTKAATAKLKLASEHSRDLSIQTAKAESSDDLYVPFDMSLGLAAGYVATEEKTAKLKEANTHIANGNEKKAAEILKLANIDVTVKAALLPVNASIRHAEDAMMLLDDGMYYEANLALRAIESSIVVEYFSIDAVPAQGSKG